MAIASRHMVGIGIGVAIGVPRKRGIAKAIAKAMPIGRVGEGTKGQRHKGTSERTLGTLAHFISESIPIAIPIPTRG